MSPTPEPVHLSDRDCAAFLTLEKPRAQYCVPRLAQTPQEAPVYFAYLNQGGANVIFKIHSWSQSTERERPFIFLNAESNRSEAIPIRYKSLNGKVLRINKGLSKTLRCEEVIAGFYDHVRPLFSPQARFTIVVNSSSTNYSLHSDQISNTDLTMFLMDHQGVGLHSKVMANLSSKCDAICKEDTDANTSRWGILLPDLSAIPGSSVTIEVKPKWLAQSPTAPPDAVRCRTCALQLLKPKDPKGYLCPLQLLDGTHDTIYKWVKGRVAEQMDNPADALGRTDEIASHITNYITEGSVKPLLEHLRALQSRLDHCGILGRDQLQSFPQEIRDIRDRNLRLAMTLRDCSLYIRICYASSRVDPSSLECKLGDLDFKSQDKMDDWADKERELLESGAYTRRTSELVCHYTKS
ncbi:inositol-pentakisphosphate 2-kinase [Phaeosphaeria sp. MPI-PUGE-AT-0046c]|nr:inositol-pentakisphosphate 2-kinase [Phaeosphaeria sp. MPI-PUGE-AT-0046c]